MSFSGIRRVSVEHGHPVQRVLQIVDVQYQALIHATHAARMAVLRTVHVETLSEHLRATWPSVISIALACTILGGVLAVPMACVFALLTGLMHASAPLRSATPQVFGLAVLWFLGAIIGAHFQPRRAS